MRGEQPIRIARALAIETKFDRCMGEAGDESRLEVHLQREHDVEGTTLQFSTHVDKRPPPARAIEKYDVINERMTAYQRRRPRLKDPRDARRWSVRFECVNDRHDVYGVANCTHHHDADLLHRS